MPSAQCNGGFQPPHGLRGSANPRLKRIASAAGIRRYCPRLTHAAPAA
jgi:hypothetical protein